MTHEQVTAALREVLPLALREALPAWYTLALTLLTVAVLAAAGGYFGSYLQARGQRQAIRETLDQIERKAEEIKAEVAGGLWVAQARWELKRKIYFSLLRNLDRSRRYMGRLRTHLGRAPEGESDPAWVEWNRQFELLDRGLHQAVERSNAAKAVAGVLLSDEAVRILGLLFQVTPRAPEETYAGWIDRNRVATMHAYGVLLKAAEADLRGVARTKETA